MLAPTKRAKPETLYGLTHSLWWELICKHRLHLEDWVHLTRTSPFFAFLQEEITKRANYVFCNLPREHRNKPLVEVDFPRDLFGDKLQSFFDKHPHALVIMYERTIEWYGEIDEQMFYGVYSSKKRLLAEIEKRKAYVAKDSLTVSDRQNYVCLFWTKGRASDYCFRVSKALGERKLKAFLTY